MPRGRKIDKTKSLDKRIVRTFRQRHRRTLEKMDYALAAQHRDCPENLTLLAISLAPTREDAEADFAKVIGSMGSRETIPVRVPFWYAARNLGDVPVIVAGGKNGEMEYV